MAEFVAVAKVGEIPECQSKTVVVGDRRVSVFCWQGEYYALADECPHMGAPLGTGDVRDGMVVCDRHLWAFRLADGVCPESMRLKAETFEVRVEDGEVRVRVPEEREEEGGVDSG